VSVPSKTNSTSTRRSAISAVARRWTRRRWLRRISRELDAAHHSTVLATIMELAPAFIPGGGLTVIASYMQCCVAELRVADGTRLLLARCHLRTVEALRRDLDADAYILRGARRLGSFWALDLDAPGRQRQLLATDVVVLQG
jgi:hypothetical protein